ncbi:family protein [Stylonychia lemnae]|uniref:Family protein n=1 Tax=Stylonychia lemnae TaxID=5949 RepID=A0A078BA35_STYLE|nr:family protein [Stylonychia lemnae]|eukprot:CDW91106.1 family protein [Stylonychia lemnae]
MKESLVLAINMTTVVTELSRHLALSGINLHLVDIENVMIDSSHSESDFLFAPNDIGKLRVQVVAEKLREMNPYVKITHETERTLKDLLEIRDLQSLFNGQKYSAIVSGFTRFSDSKVLNSMARDVQTPFYSLNSCGLNGFFFADICHEFTYTTKNKQTNEDEIHTITKSVSLDKFIANFSAQDRKLSNVPIRKTSAQAAFLFYTIMSLALQEQTQSPQPVASDDQMMIDQNPENVSEGQRKDSEFDKVCQILIEKGVGSKIIKSQEFRETYDRVQKCFNVEFSPSCSLIGAIVSQEIVKVITQRDHPGYGMYVYDSVTQQCTQQLVE